MTSKSVNNDQLTSVIWFIIGALIAMNSLRYKLGTLSTPGSGFMPFVVGLAICVLAVIGFGDALVKRRYGTGWKSPLQGVKWWNVFVVLAALIAYALLLRPLGFVAVTVLFMAFLLRVVEPQSWKIVMLGALSTAFASYLLFDLFLKAQLPRGLWGF